MNKVKFLIFNLIMVFALIICNSGIVHAGFKLAADENDNVEYPWKNPYPYKPTLTKYQGHIDNDEWTFNISFEIESNGLASGMHITIYLNGVPINPNDFIGYEFRIIINGEHLRFAIDDVGPIDPNTGERTAVVVRPIYEHDFVNIIHDCNFCGSYYDYYMYYLINSPNDDESLVVAASGYSLNDKELYNYVYENYYKYEQMIWAYDENGKMYDTGKRQEAIWDSFSKDTSRKGGGNWYINPYSGNGKFSFSFVQEKDYRNEYISTGPGALEIYYPYEDENGNQIKNVPILTDEEAVYSAIETDIVDFYQYSNLNHTIEKEEYNEVEVKYRSVNNKYTDNATRVIILPFSVKEDSIYTVSVYGEYEEDPRAEINYTILEGNKEIGIATVDGIPYIDTSRTGDRSVNVFLKANRTYKIYIHEKNLPLNVFVNIIKVKEIGEIASSTIPMTVISFDHNTDAEWLEGKKKLGLDDSRRADTFREHNVKPYLDEAVIRQYFAKLYDGSSEFTKDEKYKLLYGKLPDNSNTGSSNTGSSNTGSSSTGSSNTGSSNTESSNTGSSNTGSSNTGSLSTNTSTKKEKHKPSFLEALISRIIISIHKFLLDIVEWALGMTGSMSIDKIIFNDFPKTVIDLTPLGGISIDSGIDTSFFSNEGVIKIIKILTTAFKILTFAIYIIMLLFIGIKILLNVGKKEQKNYLKYFEYWISGIIILVVLPYFLPAIPAMNNALVGIIRGKAYSMSDGYSVHEVLDYLGEDRRLLAEDAEIKAVQDLIDTRVIELNARIDNYIKVTISEAQTNISSNLEKSIEKFSDFDIEERAILEDKSNKVIKIVDDNFKHWSESNEKQLQKAIQDVRAYIYMCANTELVVNQILNELPEEVRNDTHVYSKIQEILNTIKKDPATYQVSSELGKQLYLFRYEMEERGLIAHYGKCSKLIIDARKEYVDYYLDTEAFLDLEKLFLDYKDALIREEIEKLVTLRNGIANNIMYSLEKSGIDDGRLIYAIAWAILFNQMFAILFLYCKRIITVMVLIIIFPLVMVFYIFDKMDDGKAQSLQIWLKEFVSNIMMQTMHAALFVILVNMGIDAYNSDPENNWFILIITISLLFPGEKILRGILGLSASTVTELRNTFAATKAAAILSVEAAKAVANTAVNIVATVATAGAGAAVAGAKTAIETGKAAEKAAKAAEKAKKAEEKVKKAKKAKKRKQARDKARKIRQDKIAKGKGNRFHVIGEKLSKYKDKAVKAVGDNKVIKGVKGLYSKVSSNRILKLGKKAYNSGKYVLKKGVGLFGKSAAITMAAVDGIESYSKDGDIKSATVNAIGIARALGLRNDIGGFKRNAVARAERHAESQINNQDASRFSTRYKNGTKVKGKGKISVGNTNKRNKRSNSRIVSNTIRTKLNVNTRTQTTERNDENV